MTNNDLLAETPADQTQFDENKNYLEELVGENKKFKDVDALAKGKAYSDLMIEHMKAEQAELRKDYMALRDEYNSSAKLKDLVEQLSTQRPPSSEYNPNANEDTNPPSYDLKTIENLFETKLTEREKARTQEENFNIVNKKLTEHFGANYQAALKTHMDDLGLSKDELNNLARSNPKLLFKALQLDSQPKQDSFQAPPTSYRRSDNFAPTVTKRNWSYYENLRTKNPDVYWDPKTQVQMHKDAIELKGEFDK